MDAEVLCRNASVICDEMAWFREILERRFKLHGEAAEGDPLGEVEPPGLPDAEAPYAQVVRQFGMGRAERLLLVLSYIPSVKPDLLDPFFIRNPSTRRRFTEFGGLTGLSHGGLVPTGETAMFLIAGDDIRARLRFHHLFTHEHYLYANNILRLEPRQPQEEPPLAAPLLLTPEYRERLTTGRPYDPPFSPEFPAQRITTPFDWDDLVLDPLARQEVEGIAAWVRHEETLLHDWGLKKRLKPGFRSLFYGPPGTGKTMTASLLGKLTGLPVYRIDLARVISKYIGETEKNLASLFDHAQHQGWILFFDEADSLFGKRTETRDANDHAANQQISYLLQRIEDFHGVSILATNLRSHLDDAFARRLQAMIHFPMPDAEQRLRLWEENFKNKPYRLAPDVCLKQLALDYEISGGSIINVLRYACLKAVVRDPHEIRARDLLGGVRRELHKEGRFLKQPT